MNGSFIQKYRRSVAKGLTGLMVGAVCPTAFGQTVQDLRADIAASQSIEAVAEQLAGVYGQQQMRRLAKNGDRDSLIAAALVGPSNDAKREPPQGHAEVMQRLVREYPADPLALYTAALICHVQVQPCAHGEYQTQLLRLAPDNAVHFLLVPNVQTWALDFFRMMAPTSRREWLAAAWFVDLPRARHRKSKPRHSGANMSG